MKSDRGDSRIAAVVPGRDPRDWKLGYLGASSDAGAIGTMNSVPFNSFRPI